MLKLTCSSFSGMDFEGIHTNFGGPLAKGGRRGASSSVPNPSAGAAPGTTSVGDGGMGVILEEGGGTIGDAEVRDDVIEDLTVVGDRDGVPPLLHPHVPELLPSAHPEPMVFDGVTAPRGQDAGAARRDVGKRPRVEDDSHVAFDFEDSNLYRRGQNQDMAQSFWDLDDPFLAPRRAQLMAGAYDLCRLDELGPKYALRKIMNSGCRVSSYP